MTTFVSQDELRSHINTDSIWVAVHGKVYDLTRFIYEHPGGEEILLEQAGVQSTRAL